ncbi:hypothetical protein ATK36_5497 [Amycolatopsis sulphurea]|uniref:Uncharacterized protein n=1 Tax=Amycolatopsis sulphurea TaxID=76022 RepID=A0A2A9FHS1_9PSEU|nr:hypothetical protein ATK36_5497 [Amycolatopsis sulphurea]
MQRESIAGEVLFVIESITGVVYIDLAIAHGVEAYIPGIRDKIVHFLRFFAE